MTLHPQSARTFDVEFARRHFPALSEDWALFDNAGGSVPLRGVIERITEYMSRWQVQLGATYHHSAHAQALVDEGRAAAARLVNASTDEVLIASSSTMCVRVLARALRPRFAAGDEVIVTNLDHEANIGAWRELAADGVVIREWRFDPASMQLTLEGLEPLLNARTRLVCFTHCANVVGTIHDAAAFVRRIHAAGALACVDGVAFAPHRRVDVQAIGADFYFLSLYKVFGPHLGLMFGKREHLLAAKGQNHSFIPETDIPYKLQPGSVVHELTASLPAIPHYLVALDAHHHGGAGAAGAAVAGDRLARAFELIAAHEAALASPLLEFLSQRKGVRVMGSTSAEPAHRVPTIAFTIEGRDAAEIPTRLDAMKLGIRYGHFYAYRAMETLGLLERNGVVRVSMAHYNTAAEVERLIAALDRVL